MDARRHYEELRMRQPSDARYEEGMKSQGIEGDLPWDIPEDCQWEPDGMQGLYVLNRKPATHTLNENCQDLVSAITGAVPPSISTSNGG